MSLNRGKNCLLALVLASCLGSTASAQFQIGDLQLFAPVDASCYEDPEPSEGFFFSFEVLVWSISSPEKREIGEEGASRRVFVLFPGTEDEDATGGGFEIVVNSLNTGEYEDYFHRGNRVELGYIEDDCGWVLGSFKMNDHVQQITNSDVNVIFDDPQGRLIGFVDLSDEVGGPPDEIDDDLDGDFIHGRDGIDIDGDGTPDLPFTPTDFGDTVPLPVNFVSATARYHTEGPWSVDAMRVWRTTKSQFGGWFELGVGARFFRFEDEFNFFGEGGTLDDTDLNAQADNSIVGPEFGMRWFNKCCRWMNVVDFRFTPGINFQSVRQAGGFASNLLPGARNFPLNFGPTGFNNDFHDVEFSPIVELRIQTSFQLTREISFKAGYNALYTDGIARSSSMIDYELGTLGILKERNSQDLTTHGLTVGIEVNR